jgi:PAS domain S-box-containing protein
MMPIMNGFEACTILKTDPDTIVIPIIMVTALRDVQYRIKGIQAGADEFLYRPHHREELLVRVRSLIQLKRTRQRLEEERNRLQLLYDISQAITTQLDLTQMMASIITYTQTAVQAAKGNIMLLNEQGNVTHKFLIRAGEKEVSVATNVAQEVMRDGLAGWLVRHNQADIVVDANEDTRWVHLPDDETVVGSAIGVPLSRMDRVVGVLILVHPKPNYFTRSHLSLLETIGGQLTAAIENGYLFADVKEERRKMEALLAQSTDAIITTDEDLLVSLFNHAAESIFGLSAENVIGEDIRQFEQLLPLQPLIEQARLVPAFDEISVKSSNKILYASLSPVPDVGYVAVMKDITEMKAMELRKLEWERQDKKRVKDTFTRYMAPTLVDQVLSNEPGLLGKQERIHAVVLFADLRGFTRMIVDLEANTAILVLNEFFSRMTDVVYEFEGTIFDLAGDELMVGFNVPVAQSDAPERALRTAIRMQQVFDQIRQELYEEVNTVLGLGVGIDQGDVLVGNVGAETRMNFAMVGEAVNTAHRLVDLADDGQIVFSAEIANRTKSRHTIISKQPIFSLGYQELKGKSKPEELFCIVSPRTPLPEKQRV